MDSQKAFWPHYLSNEDRLHVESSRKAISESLRLLRRTSKLIEGAAIQPIPDNEKGPPPSPGDGPSFDDGERGASHSRKPIWSGR
jgi:hypothetical protein